MTVTSSVAVILGPNEGEIAYLLLIEKGKLSPGGGRPSPPLLRVDVVKLRTEAKLRAARAIAESEI